MSVDQTILNWLFALVGATLGWILKVVWDAIQDLKRDMRQIERELPVVYTRKDDFREEIREMKADMERGFAKLEAALAVMAKRLDRTP